jgi:hypothetical protein
MFLWQRLTATRFHTNLHLTNNNSLNPYQWLNLK